MTQIMGYTHTSQKRQSTEKRSYRSGQKVRSALTDICWSPDRFRFDLGKSATQPVMHADINTETSKKLRHKDWQRLVNAPWFTQKQQCTVAISMQKRCMNTSRHAHRQPKNGNSKNAPVYQASYQRWNIQAADVRGLITTCQCSMIQTVVPTCFQPKATVQDRHQHAQKHHGNK